MDQPAAIDPEQKMEISPLSGDVECAIQTVQVHIYRLAGTRDGWTLKVIDHEGSPIVWPEAFASDEAAYEAFENAVIKDGLGSSVETSAPTRRTAFDVNPAEEHTLSEHQSKEWKQAEAAFAKEQSLPISMPAEEPQANVAETNLARQKAARLARDAEQPKAKGGLK
ncbi:hypothetical protein [Methylobacterium sp. WL12]|uniref:hypothetical protein n=1 Tax=Methylobacterium sp. WL12 TaxID=2603890 RepID=UPI001FF04430|nr:hypothetical protein [Methylobacterium sp. WL12]